MKTLDEITALTPWIPTWHETGACADRRHILWIYEVLKRTGVRRTLEIGVHSGCSSSAFVAAGVPDAHFCDPTRRVDAMSVINGGGIILYVDSAYVQKYYHGTFHQRKGVEVLRSEPRFDLVFVDGRHDMEAVTEELEALLDNPPDIIIAHDVNSTRSGFAHCEGAQHLGDWIRNEWTFAMVEGKERPGEMTQRGLAIGWSDPKYTKAIHAAYQEMN